jgi:hypothetical protein
MDCDIVTDPKIEGRTSQRVLLTSFRRGGLLIT